MLPPLHIRRWGSRLPLSRHGEGRGAMRKRLMVLLMAAFMVVMSAAPAMAVSGKPKNEQPIFPPGMANNNGNGGLNNEQASEQVPDIQSGRANRFLHGSPQNGK